MAYESSLLVQVIGTFRFGYYKVQPQSTFLCLKKISLQDLSSCSFDQLTVQKGQELPRPADG